jgi:hypothetical protein
MSSNLTTLVTAIVTDLAAQTFDTPAIPRAALAPILTIMDIELHVLVLQRSDSLERIGAGADPAVQTDYEVHVVVQRKFGEGEDIEHEGLALVELCAAIALRLLSTPMDLGGYNAWCTGASREEVLSLADLLVEREFFAVITTRWITATC